MLKRRFRYVILLPLLGAAALLTGCETTTAQRQGGASRPPVSPATLKPQAMDILRQSLRHENPYLRNHAVEVVAETRQREMFSDIIGLMDDETIAVRFSATVAAGQMRCYGCETQVRDRLEDADENVQLAAAYSMVKLGYPDYHDRLRQAIDHRDQTARANAVLLLGKLGDRDDLDLLYQAMRDDRSSERVKIQAIESIARLGDTRMYRSKLWALLISKYADDRVMGIRGMGALGTEEAQKAIATMLSDDVQEVRLCAAEQLGRLGDLSGRDEVARFFAQNANLDQDDVAAVMAVMAIGRIAAPELTGYLPQALDSRSEIVRLIAAQSVLLLAL